MRRREILKGIGTSSIAALGVTGLATADDSVEAGGYVVSEIDGERQTLSVEEFEQHPETGTLSDVEPEGSCDTGYECCECCSACCSDPCRCAGYCGSCSGC